MTPEQRLQNKDTSKMDEQVREFLREHLDKPQRGPYIRPGEIHQSIDVDVTISDFIWWLSTKDYVQKYNSTRTSRGGVLHVIKEENL